MNSSSNHTPSEKTVEKIGVLILVCCILVAFKLWLALALRLHAGGTAIVDDRLFVEYARSMIAGNWLGDYDETTLAKGQFYSLFVAACFYAGVPLLFAQQLLHTFAVGVFTIAIRPIIKSRIVLVLVFAALLFDPYMYSMSAARVLREGIYPALSLLVLACAVQLVAKPDRSLRSFVFWSTSLGFALIAFWTTREEGIWLVPTLLLFLGFATVRMWREEVADRWKRFSLLVMPFVMLALGIFSVASLNNHYYGVFNTVEFKNEAFKRGVGAISRVEIEPWRQYVVASKNTRQAIYEVSPSFRQLEPFFEGPKGANIGLNAVKSFPDLDLRPDDIAGGWFVWAVRTAVAEAGHYSDSQTAEKFYNQLAVEINTACDDGRLTCGPERIAVSPRWRNEYIALMYDQFFVGTKMFRFIAMGTNNIPYDPILEDHELIEDITRSRLTQEFPARKRLATQWSLDKQKYKIMVSLTWNYVRAYQYVPVLALGCFVVMCIVEIRRRKPTLLTVVAAGLLIAFAARGAILLYITVTSFRAIFSSYFGPSYALLIVFSIMCIYHFSEFLLQLVQNRNNTPDESSDSPPDVDELT